MTRSGYHPLNAYGNDDDDMEMFLGDSDESEDDEDFSFDDNDSESDGSNSVGIQELDDVSELAVIFSKII